MFRERLRVLPRHLAFLRQVALIRDQHLVETLARVLLHVLVPPCHVLEGLRLGHVVHEHHPVGAAVITLRDRAKSFLARRVPDLKFDLLVVDLHRLQGKQTRLLTSLSR